MKQDRGDPVVPQDVSRAYDEPALVAEYIAMRQHGRSANELLEEPVIRALLDGAAGDRCLDLGCGYGYYSNLVALRGFTVTAIDRAALMIESAKKLNAHPLVNYQTADIADVEFAPSSFDLVISNLVLHYLDDLPSVASRIHRWLAPGGVLIFSVEHPVYTANRRQVPPPWSDSSSSVWGVADYFASGARFGEFGLKFHHTLSEYLTAFLDAGFGLLAVSEPCPTAEIVHLHPKFAEAQIRPTFLILKWISRP